MELWLHELFFQELSVDVGGIPNRESTLHELSFKRWGMNGYYQQVMRVLLWILLLNFIVAVAKLVAGIVSGSLTVVSDAVHSSIDMLNNVVGIVVIRFASTPPDREHPYGHAKFETLAAFSIAGFLFLACFELGSRAVRQLFSSDFQPPNITVATVATILTTLLVNIFVTRYELRRGRELGSELLTADAMHTRTDVFVTISVLLSFILIHFGYYIVDALFALGIAGVIAWSGFELFRQTVPVLVDAAMVDEHRIEQIVLAVSGVRGCEKIRSRGRPGDLFIDLVLKVDAQVLEDAHEITEEVEKRLRAEFGRASITIHFEP